MNLFTFVVVVLLLFLDAIVFFVIGYTVPVFYKVKRMRESGWTFIPPKEDFENGDSAKN